MIPSAAGERQILPMQTNSRRVGGLLMDVWHKSILNVTNLPPNPLNWALVP